MASVDKTSVRNEVGQLKADFERLCAAGNMTGEIKVLMNSLFVIVESFLKEQQKKTTRTPASHPRKLKKMSRHSLTREVTARVKMKTTTSPKIPESTRP